MGKSLAWPQHQMKEAADIKCCKNAASSHCQEYDTSLCSLMAVLNESASVLVLSDAMMKCAKFTKIVLPKIAKQEINIFQKSQTNCIRSVNNLYSGGIASRQKYNSVRSLLMMCLDDAEVKRKHIEFMSNNPVPRLLPIVY